MKNLGKDILQEPMEDFLNFENFLIEFLGLFLKEPVEDFFKNLCRNSKRIREIILEGF